MQVRVLLECGASSSAASLVAAAAGGHVEVIDGLLEAAVRSNRNESHRLVRIPSRPITLVVR
eukprot:SAG11_NODE_12_length_27025_cov_37.402681_20_plen_62_part_00